MTDQEKSPPSAPTPEGSVNNYLSVNFSPTFPDPASDLGIKLAWVLRGGRTGCKATADALTGLGWPIKVIRARPRLRINGRLLEGGNLYALSRQTIEAAGAEGEHYSRRFAPLGVGQ